MIAGIIFRPAAELELQEAYDWYEEREPGLGVEFMRCVDGCVQLIRRHPEIFPATHKHVRQGVLRRFPYSVLYFISGDRIIVVSVFHTSRDPKIWKMRV
jgi:plasmid stabilization system protein ParE